MAAPCHHRSRGVALVIVLVFLVLLTVLIVAFFSRSLSEQHISNSSVNQSKADFFAQGAVATIIGDLKQEIVDGSTAVSAGSDATLYPPKTANGSNAPTAIPCFQINAGFVPTFSGGIETDGLANVLKRSAHGVPFYSGPYAQNGPSRAAGLSSSTPSINGRFVTLARWNKPLLMPATSTTDNTPASGVTFVAPDWILVARDGSNPTSADINTVGRYAYTIYNEGGLLDANVAGYPAGSDAFPATGTGTFPPFPSRKNALAYADLTVSAGGQPLLTPSQVNALVGWRNYASSQPASGSFPNFNPLPTPSSDPKLTPFDRSVMANANGFLGVQKVPLFNRQSDRTFTSRQQLITFFMQGLAGTGSRAALQNALQYFGTFSRGLNQPSLYPVYPNSSDANAGLASNRLPIKDSGGVGQQGNSAFGSEANYNPPFLKMRLQAAIDRADGSRGLVGDPLVQKRFALNRLAWVTCKGPSASVSANDPLSTQYANLNIPRAFLDLGTPENIQKFFGLTWSGGNTTAGYWTYSDGINVNGATVIRSLAQVCDLGTREPNFFELLKASINVGSVAKATAIESGTTTVGNYETSFDQRVDFQIFQIAANIIDQFDPDSYPTHIRVADALGINRDFYGKENLPYFNGIHTVGMNAASQDGNGQVLSVDVPSIWNPIDASSTFPAPGKLAPKYLRVSTINSDIAQIVPQSSNLLQVIAFYVPNPASNANEQILSISSASWNGFDAAAITFDNNANLYREPTLLAQPNVPSGSNLAMGPGYSITTKTINGTPSSITWSAPFTEAASDKKIIGWILGAVPNKVAGQTFERWYRNVNAAGRTIRMEWSDDSTTWSPYQELYWDGCYQYFTSSEHPSPVIANWNGGKHWSQQGYDPRSNRFYAIRTENYDTPTVKLASNEYQLDTLRSTVTAGVANAGSTTATGFVSNLDSDIPTSKAGWGGVTKSGIPGMSEQNNPKASLVNDNGTGPQYYSDPDGVVRRAMGAWVPYGATSGPPATTATGLPLASPAVASSRPIILNRPFRSVGELSYTFRDTPWKNLDFSTPESGDSGLLDVFCIAPDQTERAIVAGKVDLNTRQQVVLKAIISGACRDEIGTSIVDTTHSDAAASALLARTTGTGDAMGPLTNISQMVGKYTAGAANAYGQPYDGWTNDLGPVGSSDPIAVIQRLRDAPLRALSQVGETRVWSLLIDVIAQTGRYPKGATGVDKFFVEGEQRYWVHVAIDRLTGQVLDKQIEIVKE